MGVGFICQICIVFSYFIAYIIELHNE